ncbi:hypothetical protein [Silvanigrella aquatica]|uniref:Uncharacterized protein n=1 Tax=Silvanigrella aquatica TaxID=1915309 RepID=A0A1L4CZH0_9BACT|nr:hypothetical protein [Silvanigrella aquatica]APJ03335.1 hypothetical protein AXG55_05215 [Silvanigrella aquatica]
MGGTVFHPHKEPMKPNDRMIVVNSLEMLKELGFGKELESKENKKKVENIELINSEPYCE